MGLSRGSLVGAFMTVALAVTAPNISNNEIRTQDTYHQSDGDPTSRKTKPYDLGEEGREKVDYALNRYLGMDKEDRAALIEDIEQTGEFRQLGYGSLIGDPASPPDKQYLGEVLGWEKGAFCKDRHYRGTPEKLGVTMGALPVDKTADGYGTTLAPVSLSGVVQEIRADEGDGNFADRILENVQKFALRETSLNPIYEYRVVDVETKSQGTVKAIICAADPENPLYLGRDGEAGGLSMEEKAAIIATSKGVDGASSRNTGMAYWRDHVKCCELGGFDVDPKIKRLIEQAEIYRAELEQTDPELFAELTAIESKNSPTGAMPGVTYATPVYDVSVISASDDPRTLAELRTDAINKASLLDDPLSSSDIAHIDQMKKELETALQTPTMH